MFAANPDAIKLFPKIVKSSVGDLKDNKDLYNYAYSAFAGLNMIIKGIDDVKTVATLFRGSDNPSIFLDSLSASLNVSGFKVIGDPHLTVSPGLAGDQVLYGSHEGALVALCRDGGSLGHRPQLRQGQLH